jgi:peptidoglycan/LPS O-acetylase OafA/YrhL
MSKIFPLQSLRGICVLIVMLVHFNPYKGSIFHIQTLASAAVFMFLVLSGFIISMIYDKKILNRNDLIKFYKKRFFRMYPLHVLFLFIFLILEFLKLYIENNYSIIPNNKAFEINNIYSFFSHLFLYNIFNNIVTYNLPAWTVSGEFFASIFFGAICLIFKDEKKISKFFIFMIIIILLCFNFYDKKFIQYTTYFAFFSVIYCFIIGYFFLKIFQLKNKIYLFLINNFFQILNLFFLFLFLSFDFLNFLFPLSSGIIIIYLSSIKNINLIGKIFYNRFLIFTGKISYTLYISHFFVYWTYTQIFRYILELENHNSFENTQFIESNSSIYLIKIILSFITTYFVSIQLYNKFEKRFI